MTTNNLNIFITNLGKYNEGELVGKWIELPAVDTDTLGKELESIGVKYGTRYEEYFITDYEFPCQISEYDSIFKLNDTLNSLSSDELEFLNNPTLEAAQTIVSERDYDEPLTIMHTDDISELIAYKLENGEDWTSIAITLSDVGSLNNEYYIYDDSENLNELTDKDIESYIKEIADKLITE